MKKSIIVMLLVSFSLSACNSHRRPEAISQACPTGHDCTIKTKDEGTAAKIQAVGMAILLSAMGASAIINKNKKKH